MKIYKIFYILGLMFMALFFLISGKYYKEDD